MRDRSWSNNWFGVALIGLGLLFLVQNYLGYELHNWWALFILITAVGSFGAAYSLWRAHGSPTAAASSFTMGVLFTAVAASSCSSFRGVASGRCSSSSRASRCCYRIS